MDESRIRDYIKALNSHVVKSDNNRVTFSCLFSPWLHENGVDNNPSSSITIKPHEESRYHCFSCQSSGYLDEIILSLRTFLQGDPDKQYYNLKEASRLVSDETEDSELSIPDWDDDEVLIDKVVPWSESFVDSFLPVTASQIAKDYLLARNVSPKLWLDLDLRFDSSENRICFPIRDFKGQLVGMRGRDITNKHPLRYRAYKYQDHYNKQVWHGEDTINLEQTVVMTESVFDLASIREVYSNVIGSFSSGISTAQAHRVSGALDIITLYDFGAGGNIARETIDKKFPDAIIQHMIPTENQDDAGNMDAIDVWDLLHNQVDVDKPTI